MQKVQQIATERANIEKRILTSREELTKLEGSISATLNIFGTQLSECTPEWADQQRQRLHNEKYEYTFVNYHHPILIKLQARSCKRVANIRPMLSIE